MAVVVAVVPPIDDDDRGTKTTNRTKTTTAGKENNTKVDRGGSATLGEDAVKRGREKENRKLKIQTKILINFFLFKFGRI